VKVTGEAGLALCDRALVGGWLCRGAYAPRCQRPSANFEKRRTPQTGPPPVPDGGSNGGTDRTRHACAYLHLGAPVSPHPPQGRGDRLGW